MSVWDFDGLLAHVGHKVEVMQYGLPAVNAAVECESCGLVLLDFDRDEDRTQADRPGAWVAMIESGGFAEATEVHVFGSELAVGRWLMELADEFGAATRTAEWTWSCKRGEMELPDGVKVEWEWRGLEDKEDRCRELPVGVGSSDALAQISAVMSGREWSSDTLDEIAAIVRGSGREINDVAEEVSDV